VVCNVEGRGKLRCGRGVVSTLRRVRTPIRRLVAAVLLIIAALALGACGGGGDDEDVQALLDKAFKQQIESADLKIEAEIEVEGNEQFDRPIRIEASGPFRDNEGRLPSANVDLSVSAGAGRPFELGLLSTGTRTFVKFQDVYYEQPRSQVEQANRSIGRRGERRGSLKALGLDPRQWLEDAEDEGDEEVAGVETTHVSGKLDVGKVVQDFNDVLKRSGGALGGATGQTPPRPLSQSDLDKVEDVVKDPSFDVYVGKEDNVIRRVAGRVELDVPEGDRDQVGGIEGGSLSFSIEFSKVNGNQRIEAPANARPISDLAGSLGAGALGGGGSGSGSGGGSAPTAPPPSGSSPNSDAFKRYADCLDRADPQDTDALQRCAELLRR
jgi:hypothetical protein